MGFLLTLRRALRRGFSPTRPGWAFQRGARSVHAGRKAGGWAAARLSPAGAGATLAASAVSKLVGLKLEGPPPRTVGNERQPSRALPANRKVRIYEMTTTTKDTVRIAAQATAAFAAFVATVAALMVPVILSL